MKKSILILSVVATLLSAQGVTVSDLERGGLIKDYSEDTGFGQSKSISDAKRALKSAYFQKALKELYGKWKKQKVNGKEVVMPDYKKATDDLYKATQENAGPFAGYLGVNMLQTIFMGHPIKGMEKDFRRFSRILAEEGSCLGYLYLAKSYTKAGGMKPNYKTASSILREGFKKCNKKTSPPYTIQNMKEVKALSDTMMEFGR